MERSSAAREKREKFLILDDSTLEKPYSRELMLVYRHWSGKQQKVVNGINLISLVRPQEMIGHAVWALFSFLIRMRK